MPSRSKSKANKNYGASLSLKYTKIISSAKIPANSVILPQISPENKYQRKTAKKETSKSIFTLRGSVKYSEQSQMEEARKEEAFEIVFRDTFNQNKEESTEGLKTKIIRQIKLLDNVDEL